MNLITRLRRRHGCPISKQVQMFISLMRKNGISDKLLKERRRPRLKQKI